MKKIIRDTFRIAGIFIFGGIALQSCETDPDNLGEQFFANGAAQGSQSAFDVVAYNLSNNDTIRVDSTRLESAASGYATLGAFSEPVFGMQKSSYVTQVRMPSYPASFGTNAVADSAVLTIKPLYAADSLTTATDANYVYPDGGVSAKKVVTSYPISKYGKSKKTMTLKVYEVNDFLGSYTDKIYSDRNVGMGDMIGSKTLTGNVTNVVITKNSDNSALWSSDAAGIRIPLDATFFQNKIIAQSGTANMADAASFIRYFKGLKVMVDENDGYIFQFKPSAVSLKLYYKYDVTSNGTTTRTPANYTFDMAPYIPSTSGLNVYYNQIQYDRANTPVAAIPSVPNSTAGDAKIYAQGMGGPGIGLKIPQATVQSIRDLYNQKKIAIISAKIRLYVDSSTWGNTYAQPSSFVLRQSNLYTYLSDLWSLASAGYKTTTPNTTTNPSYYDLSVTQTMKDLIEKSTTAGDFNLVANVGNYTFTTSGIPTGYVGTAGAQGKFSQNFNTRAYTPNRVVLVGTDATNAKRAQLILTYGSK